MPKNITEIGTCNFVSAAAAKKYYREARNMDGLTEYGQNKEIQRKIDDKEIEIGPPPIKPGQTLRIYDGRYRIREENKGMNPPMDPQ